VPAVVKRALKEIDREKKLAAAEAALISERRRLEKEILEISELEQRRIGQDLHDGLCQHLAGIELMSQVLEQALAKKAKAEAAQAARIAQHVRESISQTRMLARGLSPVELEANGLMSALEELAANTEKLFGITCHFRCDAAVLVHDNAMAGQLYRIAQEAVRNGIKHGKAGRIEIVLNADAEKMILSVTDNGLGLPKNLLKRKGMGLRIMQYRAGMIAGSLTIKKRPEGGAIMACLIPKRTGEAAKP
jgi:signal transduction histidine kinase